MDATGLHAFISYKSEYRNIALRVRDKLHSWGHETWFDQDDIPKGAYFRDAIQAGLEASDVVVGILTEKALKSREVVTEWDYAFSGQARLLLLRYEDVNLPYWLAGVQYIDCTKDEEVAFDQLRQALANPNTSKYIGDASPEYISRYRDITAIQAYHPPESPKDNRAKMLYNVYQTWIQGVLQPNLPAGAIDLGLGLKPESVLRHADYDDYTLPDSTHHIAQIFTDMKGELLILGDPGSGKTILLLQLAETLLGRAQHDVTQPMPAVFNLSSWGKGQKPLAEWLIDELRRGYGIPKKTGKDWVMDGKLTLLLDGLDEIMPTATIMQGGADATVDERAVQLRSACIAAINAYRVAHPHVDVVICSRIKDYNVLKSKLDLNAAILFCPLTDVQIAGYLNGDEHAGTCDLIEKEGTARHLAGTPFLLTVMKMAYAHIPYRGSPHHQLKLDDESERQNHLLNEYVEGQLRQHENSLYRREQTMGYLRWLAHQMVQNKISVFYIEDIQPSWLNDPSKYNLILGLIGGLDIGLFFGLVGGIIAGIITGLIIGFTSSMQLGLLGGTIGGAFVGVLIGVLSIRETSTYGIKFAERLSWSFSKAHFRYVLYVGLIGGPIIGSIGGFIVAISSGFHINFGGLLLSLLVGSIGGLVGGLVFGLVGGSIFGLSVNLESEKHIEIRINPNMGLRMSLWNSIKIGLIATVIVGTIVSLSGKVYLVLISGIGFGIVTGLAYGGGMAIIQHVILRWLLSYDGAIPFGRYDKFLDVCSMLGLLRKVGGGYIFRHRTLLEYFAKQYENKQSV